MEKKREQDFDSQEAQRLSGVFSTPFSARPTEREKPLDQGKAADPKSRTWERER